MKLAAGVLVVLVALIHLGIMFAEMYPFDHPMLLVKLEQKLGFAEGQGIHASPIVVNAGLFNGFFAAGLFWGWKAKFNSFQIRTFFLVCVTIAGIFGAMTLPSLLTLWIQTLPAIVALVVNWLARHNDGVSDGQEPIPVKLT